jgi:hemolysin III
MSSHDLHPTSGYTNSEELANSITHLAGTVLSIAGLVVAVVLAAIHSNAYMITACSIYGASLILLHLSSTLYHSFRNLKWKKVFLVADHGSIYLLIAGTYTPFCLGPLRGVTGWSLFGIIWGLALVGVFREILWPKRGTLLSTALYLAMGWLVVAFLYPLIKTLSMTGLVLLLSGGLLYSFGVIFYRWHSLKYHHAIWHLFVVSAAACQYFAVLTLLK